MSTQYMAQIFTLHSDLFVWIETVWTEQWYPDLLMFPCVRISGNAVMRRHNIIIRLVRHNDFVISTQYPVTFIPFILYYQTCKPSRSLYSTGVILQRSTPCRCFLSNQTNCLGAPPLFLTSHDLSVLGTRGVSLLSAKVNGECFRFIKARSNLSVWSP